MARIRTIKPELPHSESMGRVSREARLCFILIWTVCDDSGRTRGNSRILASLLYPYDNDAKDRIEEWLDELERENCIVRYVIDDATYLQVVAWQDHQRIDKPTPSKLPEFVEGSRITRESSRGLPVGLEGKGREGKGMEGKGPQSVEQGSTAIEGDPVERIFEHWRQVHRHPKASLDAKRRKLIRAALEAYSEADLCLAISGYLNSPHHMGDNDRGTTYTGIELLLRDAAHIDAGLRFHADPPRTDLSRLTRRNVAATEGWEPPEVRNGTN